LLRQFLQGRKGRIGDGESNHCGRLENLLLVLFALFQVGEYVLQFVANRPTHTQTAWTLTARSCFAHSINSFPNHSRILVLCEEARSSR
jgi:hypothetical protein